MSDQELEEFRRRVLETRANRIATREIARQLLIEEGMLTEDGQLTENYGGERAA